MRILYVGNFSQRHCTENHIALTLEDLGHEVVRLQENELTEDWVLDRPDGVDLLLFTRTWGGHVMLENLKRLKELFIPTASYHLDLYVGLQRESGLDDDPFWRTDFVFTPDGSEQAAEVFKRKGINHTYIKPGVYKQECYMATPNQDAEGKARPLDVMFVGGGDAEGMPHQYGHSEWPYRGKLIKWLQDTYGERFHKYGFPQETVRNKELNQLYANTKVVVGDSLCLNFDHPYYWSDRVYETLGRGGFLIHPYIKGLEEEFTDGEHLVFYEYNNWEQLKEKINYYLEHDDEREAIRKRGHQFVKANATYHNRLTQMLDVILGAGAVPKSSPVPTSTPIKINLGAGSEPTAGWVNVDWIKGEGIDVEHNLLLLPWPFDDEVADEIKAIDVLEHMPNFTPDNKSTPIEFVRECWRILQPGGKLFITVPHWQSPNCWIDPTHVRGFDQRSMDYFDPDTDIGKWYGYYSPDRKFKVSSVRTENDNVEFSMVKI